MNITHAEATAAVPGTVEVASAQPAIPEFIIVAWHEAMQRDGRDAAIHIIAGRGYSVRDVDSAAQRMYGTVESQK